MKKTSRAVAVIAIAIAVAICLFPSGARPLTTGELSSAIGGGFWCDFGAGASLILGIAGLVNPAFGIASLVIGAVTVFAC